MSRLVLTLTPEQALVVERAVDLYSRLATGQVEAVLDALNALHPSDHAGRSVIARENEARRHIAGLTIAYFGYPAGLLIIGTPAVSVDGLRAYEIYQAVARGRADGDWKLMRYTGEPEPLVQWSEE